MLFRFDGLSLDPLDSETARLLMRGRRSFWFSVDGSELGVFLLQSGNCVEASSEPGPPTGLALVDHEGWPRFRLTGADASPPGLIGWVRQVWRDSRRYSLDRFPWRNILTHASPSTRLWRAADFVYRAARHARWLPRQWRLAPPPAAVEASMNEVYSNPFTSEIYENLAVVGLHDYERPLMGTCVHPGERLLDVGCGAGREAFGFAREGVEVVAVDLSPAMIEGARRLLASGDRVGLNVTFEAMSASDLRLTPGSFDAIYVACDIYARIQGRRHRIDLMRRCRELLKPGGRAIVCVTFCDPEPLRTRLLVEAPRRLLRPLLGERVPEKGDRWNPGPNPEETGAVFFKHRFADETEPLAEFNEAGFGRIERIESFFVGMRVGED